jgi:hypothetical protein
MRAPKYLSPTSYQMFWKDRSEFYLRYMADERPPRIPQTQPMSVGAAFDAYIKSFLHEHLHGPGDPKYALSSLLESQIEPQNMAFATAAGLRCFEDYISSALNDLMVEIALASGKVRFEFTISDTISGVPLLGKPDMYFQTKDTSVVLDWKVNGFCSTRTTSPAPGYIEVSDTGRCHKDCREIVVSGLRINGATTLEKCNREWAEQIAIYLWLLGEPIGTTAIAAIDQLIGPPPMRVARHRVRISSAFQTELITRLVFVWKCITTGNIFFEMSPEDSCAKMRELDMQYRAHSSGTVDEVWFTNITRSF